MGNKKRKTTFKATTFLLIALSIVLLLPTKTCSQNSITDSTNNLNPVFNFDFSGTPDLTNPSFTGTQAIRLRQCGCRIMDTMGACTGGMNITQWELRATVSGLTNPDPEIQYMDVTIMNLNFTLMGMSASTFTYSAPYNATGTFTLEDIMNNPVIATFNGSTFGPGMGACNRATNGTNNQYWTYSSDLGFTHDFFFDVMTYTPSVVYTIVCTGGNCP